MSEGKLHQFGKPGEIYQSSKTDFGEFHRRKQLSARKDIRGLQKPSGENVGIIMVACGSEIRCGMPEDVEKGSIAVICAHPENINIQDVRSAKGTNLLRGKIIKSIHLEPRKCYDVDVGGKLLCVETKPSSKYEIGDIFCLQLNENACIAVPTKR